MSAHAWSPADASPAQQPEVMAAVDDAGHESRLVLADVSRDESWLSVRELSAVTLDEWR